MIYFRTFGLHFLAGCLVIIMVPSYLLACVLCLVIAISSVASLIEYEKKYHPESFEEEKPKRKRKIKNGEYLEVSGDDPNVKMEYFAMKTIEKEKHRIAPHPPIPIGVQRVIK